MREHGRTPSPVALNDRRYRGRVETGAVYEQAVAIDDDSGQQLRLRRIEIELDTPTAEDDPVIRILTNVPASHLATRQVARRYRRRWQIETLFQRLESVLHSEVKSLGHPRAALLAFGVAVLAYNVLSVLESAIWQAHELQDSEWELSPFYIAVKIRAGYHGMMMAVEDSAWTSLDMKSDKRLAVLLLRVAKHVKPRTLRKHLRKPKPSKKKGYVAGTVARRHVSTARGLREGTIN